MSERTARRRRRQLAAMGHYRALWDALPRPLQMLVTFALAEGLGVTGHLLQLKQAVFG